MKIIIEFDTTVPEDKKILDQLASEFNSAKAAPATPPRAPADSGPGMTPPPKTETAAAKKKRQATEKKAADAAAKKTKADAADDLMDDGNAGEITLDDLKAAVKATIERTDIDQVKSVFMQHKASKISDLATETYAAVKAELEAL